MPLPLLLRSAATALLLGWPLTAPSPPALGPPVEQGEHAAASPQQDATPPAGWAPPAGTGPEDLLRPFTPPPRPWSVGHRGLDLHSSDGTVRAPTSGIVRFVGTVVDRPVLTLAHPDGTLSSLEPVQTELEVGDQIRAGEPLGTVDPSVAHCDVLCVHWGVRVPDGWQVGATVRDRYVDPALLLGWSGPSVLWPLDGSPPGSG